MQVHEAIVDVLRAEAVDTVFALMSEEIIPLLSHVEADADGDVRVVSARHEQAAAAMADGYARATDDVGVCVVGRGPAIAQTGTALLTARNNGSSVLYLVPETSLGATYDDKGFEQETFLQTTVGTVRSVRSPDTLATTLREVFRRLRLGSGPIAVQVPEDLLASDLPGEFAYAPSGAQDARDRPGRVHPDEAAVRAAVECYLDSDATKPPLVLAGRGAVAAEARPAIEALADRIDAFLATTLRARGLFDGHPFSVGFVGDLGRPLANETLGRSDFVVAVGCSLNPHTHDAGDLFAEDAKIVHVDANPAQIGRYVDVDVAVHGDAAVATRTLERALEDERIDRAGEFRTADARERIAEATPLSDRSFPETPERMDPRALVETLDDALPRDRLVVTDAGHFTTWVVDGIAIPAPDRFVWTLDFTAVGQGLPIAVGASLGAEGPTCVAFCGDAGFMMSLQAVETAARHGVPIVIVVLNDETLGAEYHQAINAGYSGDAAVVDTPDIAGLAAKLGAEAHAVGSRADLDRLDETVLRDPSGPVVVECRVNREVRHRVFGG